MMIAHAGTGDGRASEATVPLVTVSSAMPNRDIVRITACAAGQLVQKRRARIVGTTPLTGCGKMRLPSISTLRDGPSGLLRVREAIEIKDLILRSAAQERVSKDAEPH